LEALPNIPTEVKHKI